jgi:hypothetical protein
VVEVPVRHDDHVDVIRRDTCARELLPQLTTRSAERMLSRAESSVDQDERVGRTHEQAVVGHVGRARLRAERRRKLVRVDIVEHRSGR